MSAPETFHNQLFEAQSQTRRSFSLKNIANAIACAVQEMTGNPITDPNTDGTCALHYGRQYAYNTTVRAKERAREESGTAWEVPKLAQGKSGKVLYDESHIGGIFDALQEMSSHLHKRKAGITPITLRRAEEILFLPTHEQQDICDLDAPLITFTK